MSHRVTYVVGPAINPFAMADAASLVGEQGYLTQAAEPGGLFETLADTVGGMLAARKHSLPGLESKLARLQTQYVREGDPAKQVTIAYQIRQVEAEIAKIHGLQGQGIKTSVMPMWVPIAIGAVALGGLGIAFLWAKR